ncbi:Coiled-coil domain-containing protein 130 [Golovinomyces cichoracearum]|uniref:Coiled-coil domain-containing protein 130 n=1 Tax=Golovinomyces cichoracearum TaxID=62708 RepID=A0A420IC47_9PEZI|nr:Coiled-coil domain-containing protein 130 [Golovinomyces cichoracearum]
MQGFNMGRYVPPDKEGVMSGNQIHGKHALGARAKKISQGILTVRFEMPYPIWCTTCPKPTIIGQGVRFNAEKKKEGYYYSSPIYSFRMKHAACGGFIEIRTDPKNTAYVVTEGARRRDTGEDKIAEGDMKILTEAEREALRSNAFATLENKAEEKQKFAHAKKRLEELHELSEKQWNDPYEKNKRLRSSFREGRKQREKEAVIDSALQEKMSFGYDLLPEKGSDAKRAGLIEFGPRDSDIALQKVTSRPLFDLIGTSMDPKVDHSKMKKKTKAEKINSKKTAAIVAEIRSNTLAAIDPFLPGHRTINVTGSNLLAGVKRKQPTSTKENESKTARVLVDYDSD